jgi:hypothetical protein
MRAATAACSASIRRRAERRRADESERPKVESGCAPSVTTTSVVSVGSARPEPAPGRTTAAIAAATTIEARRLRARAS